MQRFTKTLWRKSNPLNLSLTQRSINKKITKRPLIYRHLLGFRSFTEGSAVVDSGNHDHQLRVSNESNGEVDARLEKKKLGEFVKGGCLEWYKSTYKH